MPTAAEPRPALRLRLTGSGDAVFFGCYAVLVGAMVGPFLAAPVAWLLAALLGQPFPPIYGATSLLMVAVSCAVLVWRNVFRYIEVGADGIVVRRGMRREFIAYDRVAAGEPLRTTDFGQFLTLVLRDGAKVEVRVDTLPERERDAFLLRFEEEMAAHRAASRDETALASLDRGGRTVPEWRTALGKLLAHGDEYRAAPLREGDVVDTLENVAATPGRRIGAALALAHGGDPEAPARIRVAAAACADARVRVALEGIAEGTIDEEALEEATREEAAEG
jgi:hypothetical protein